MVVTYYVLDFGQSLNLSYWLATKRPIIVLSQ